MRDRETIDSELRRIALGRRSIREQGRQPSSREVDELLDELLAYKAGGSVATAVKTAEPEFVPDIWLRDCKTDKTPRKRKGALRRAVLSAAMPLSLLAIAAAVAAVVVMFATHRQGPSPQPTETPASDAPPESVAPKAPASRSDIVDKAFIATLTQEGVPIPSPLFVITQGHAVCEFLAYQPNFADGVGFVQRSSGWDAEQSAKVTAGAIASYCPQSRPATVPDMAPAYQNALSDVEAIERKLQAVQRDLQGIQGTLDGIPGHQ